MTETELPEPAATEQMLRERLAGRRMIFELGFDEADFRRLRVPLFRALRSNGVERVRRRYPALLATYMTLAGTFLYEGGDYWSNLHPHLQSQDADAGRHFVRALQALNLEQFDRIVAEEKAWIWVSRILAQGGIPRSCLAPFAELVVRDVNAGVADGAELLAMWRSRGASLTQLHVPTRRFLLYAGDEAIDLVNRCIELLHDRARLGHTATPIDAGLPQYVLDAFAAVDRDAARARRETAMRDGIPRPQLRLEPYDGLGPVVILPQVAPDKLGGMWRVEAAGLVHRQEPSSYAAETVRVPPVAAVEAEFLTSDGLRRRWSFELLSSGAALFFDPVSQVLIRDPSLLAADEIWVLSAASTTITTKTAAGEEPAREIQQLPAPTGAWSGFRIQHLDLHAVRGLRLDDGQDSVATIPVIAPRARPRLDGSRLDGVHADGDAHVYMRAPVIVVPVTSEPIRWGVQVRGVDWSVSELIQPDSEGRIDLTALLPDEPFGIYRVRARGALGSDLNVRFAVIAGLKVSRPDSIVVPSSDPAIVSVEAPEVAVGDTERGHRHEIALTQSEATIVLVRLHHLGGRELDLSVAVPRLLWTIVHDTKPAISAAAHVVRVDAEEFHDHLADTLLVSVGREGVGLGVQLRDRDGRIVQALADVTTVGDSGRWAFDLGPLTSAIQAADGQRMSLYLSIGMREIHVADIVSGAQVRRVLAHVDNDVLRVSFDQHRPVRDRVVRLWSTVRPWESAVQIAVSDGETEASVVLDERLPPGNYLAEIAIDDPWTQAVRPRAADLTVRAVNVGDKDDMRAWLASLDPADPTTLVSWVLGRYRGETDYPIEHLAHASTEIAISLKTLLDDTGAGQPPDVRFAGLANVISARDTLLTEVLTRAAELETSDGFLERLTLRLLEFMDPTSDELDDALMTTLWHATPAIAALLDLPWAKLDEHAADRCQLHLGYNADVDHLDPGGAQVRQLELQAPAEQLRDLRFTLALTPVGLLHPETRMLATFDWLLAQHESDLKRDEHGPRSWFLRHQALLEMDELRAPTHARTVTEEHLNARTPPYGTEQWAGVPALLLAAAAQHRWAPGLSRRSSALTALEEALPWGQRLIRSDATLLTTMTLALQGDK